MPSVLAVEPLWTATFPGEKISGLAVSEDGSSIVAGTTTGGIYLFNQTGDLIWKKHFKGIMTVTLDPAGAMVIAGESESRESNKGALRGFSLDGTPLWVSHPGWICRMASAEDFSLFAVGNRQGEVSLYDRDGLLVWQKSDIFKTYSISSLALSPGGDSLAYALHEKTPAVYLIDLDSLGSRTLKVRSEGSGSPYHSLRYSGDGNKILCITGEGSWDTLALFSLKGTLLWKKGVPKILDSDISTTGDKILVGSADGTIRCFDKNGNITFSRDMNGPVRSLAMTPLGDTIVAGSENGEIIALDREDKTLWQYFPRRFPRVVIDMIEVSKSGMLVVAVINGQEMCVFFNGEDVTRDEDFTGPGEVVSPLPGNEPAVPGETHFTRFSLPGILWGEAVQTDEILRVVGRETGKFLAGDKQLHMKTSIITGELKRSEGHEKLSLLPARSPYNWWNCLGCNGHGVSSSGESGGYY
ncbi:MAG: WD40 repeat domain-containing protein [Methanolinea sp.]|nr:WD40 repeat domain-containing protein [Methanolinea sp.]